MTERQNKILEMIYDEKQVEVPRLAECLGVTQVTIRKDLDYLEHKQLIRRQHGIAELASKDDMSNRLAYHYQQKYKIASAIPETIRNGETLMIESGSCCALLAELLIKTKQNLTIITNSVYIANYIRPAKGHKIILLGGELLMEPQVTVGPVMTQSAQLFYVDKLFIGTDGFESSGYFTGGDIMRAETVKAMSRQAKKTIILTESAKFTQHGVVINFHADDIYAVYTDTKIPREAEDCLKQHNVIVHKIDTSEP